MANWRAASRMDATAPARGGSPPMLRVHVPGSRRDRLRPSEFRPRYFDGRPGAPVHSRSAHPQVTVSPGTPMGGRLSPLRQRSPRDAAAGLNDFKQAGSAGFPGGCHLRRYIELTELVECETEVTLSGSSIELCSASSRMATASSMPGTWSSGWSKNTGSSRSTRADPRDIPRSAATSRMSIARPGITRGALGASAASLPPPPVAGTLAPGSCRPLVVHRVRCCLCNRDRHSHSGGGDQ